MDCTRCRQPIDVAKQRFFRTRRGPHHEVCPPQPSEAQIEQTCTQMLELDGWTPFRMEFTRQTYARRRGESTSVGQVGMADHLYLRPYNTADPGIQVPDAPKGRVYNPTGDQMWIEWKRPKERVSTAQREWHKAMRAKGFLTLVAGVNFHASIEGFWEWYSSSGLKRKDIKL